MQASAEAPAGEPGSPEWLAREWRGMQRRMLACIARRESEMTPAPLVVDTALYTDPLRHAAERERLFLQTPLLAGFSLELSEPGSLLHFDAFGPPVFVLRREDGGPKASKCSTQPGSGSCEEKPASKGSRMKSRSRSAR
jgi:hypothetical protein